MLANYTCVAPRFLRDACARDAAARAAREREAKERDTREREAREREGKRAKGGKRARACCETHQTAGKSRRTDGGKATKQEEAEEPKSCSRSSSSSSFSFSSEVIKRKACLIAQHFARKLAAEREWGRRARGGERGGEGGQEGGRDDDGCFAPRGMVVCRLRADVVAFIEPS